MTLLRKRIYNCNNNSYKYHCSKRRFFRQVRQWKNALYLKYDSQNRNAISEADENRILFDIINKIDHEFNAYMENQTKPEQVYNISRFSNSRNDFYKYTTCNSNAGNDNGSNVNNRTYQSLLFNTRTADSYDEQRVSCIVESEISADKIKNMKNNLPQKGISDFANELEHPFRKNKCVRKEIDVGIQTVNKFNVDHYHYASLNIFQSEKIKPTSTKEGGKQQNVGKSTECLMKGDMMNPDEKITSYFDYLENLERVSVDKLHSEMTKSDQNSKYVSQISDTQVNEKGETIYVSDISDVHNLENKNPINLGDKILHIGKELYVSSKLCELDEESFDENDHYEKIETKESKKSLPLHKLIFKKLEGKLSFFRLNKKSRNLKYAEEENLKLSNVERFDKHYQNVWDVVSSDNSKNYKNKNIIPDINKKVIGKNPKKEPKKKIMEILKRFSDSQKDSEKFLLNSLEKLNLRKTVNKSNKEYDTIEKNSDLPKVNSKTELNRIIKSSSKINSSNAEEIRKIVINSIYDLNSVSQDDEPEKGKPVKKIKVDQHGSHSVEKITNIESKLPENQVQERIKSCEDCSRDSLKNPARQIVPEKEEFVSNLPVRQSAANQECNIAQMEEDSQMVTFKDEEEIPFCAEIKFEIGKTVKIENSTDSKVQNTLKCSNIVQIKRQMTTEYAENNYQDPEPIGLVEVELPKKEESVKSENDNKAAPEPVGLVEVELPKKDEEQLANQVKPDSLTFNNEIYIIDTRNDDKRLNKKTKTDKNSEDEIKTLANIFSIDSEKSDKNSKELVKHNSDDGKRITLFNETKITTGDQSANKKVQYDEEPLETSVNEEEMKKEETIKRHRAIMEENKEDTLQYETEMNFQTEVSDRILQNEKRKLQDANQDENTQILLDNFGREKEQNPIDLNQQIETKKLKKKSNSCQNGICFKTCFQYSQPINSSIQSGASKSVYTINRSIVLSTEIPQEAPEEVPQETPKEVPQEVPSVPTGVNIPVEHEKPPVPTGINIPVEHVELPPSSNTSDQINKMTDRSSANLMTDPKYKRLRKPEIKEKERKCTWHCLPNKGHRKSKSQLLAKAIQKPCRKSVEGGDRIYHRKKTDSNTLPPVPIIKHIEKPEPKEDSTLLVDFDNIKKIQTPSSLKKDSRSDIGKPGGKGQSPRRSKHRQPKFKEKVKIINKSPNILEGFFFGETLNDGPAGGRKTYIFENYHQGEFFSQRMLLDKAYVREGKLSQRGVRASCTPQFFKSGRKVTNKSSEHLKRTPSPQFYGYGVHKKHTSADSLDLKDESGIIEIITKSKYVKNTPPSKVKPETEPKIEVKEEVKEEMKEEVKEEPIKPPEEVKKIEKESVTSKLAAIVEDDKSGTKPLLSSSTSISGSLKNSKSGTIKIQTTDIIDIPCESSYDCGKSSRDSIRMPERCDRGSQGQIKQMDCYSPQPVCSGRDNYIYLPPRPIDDYYRPPEEREKVLMAENCETTFDRLCGFSMPVCKKTEDNLDTILSNRALFLIIEAVYEPLFIHLIDVLLSCYHKKGKPFLPQYVKNSDCEFIPIQDVIKNLSNPIELNDEFINFGCNMCRKWIPRQKIEDHMKWCHETQKQMIIDDYEKKEEAIKEEKDRPLASMPGTVCYICGKFFSKHSLPFHEHACLNKWIKWNEQLPAIRQKATPTKPKFPKNAIKEKMNEEKNRGNKHYNLHDALNDLLYQESLKNEIDLE